MAINCRARYRTLANGLLDDLARNCLKQEIKERIVFQDRRLGCGCWFVGVFSCSRKIVSTVVTSRDVDRPMIIQVFSVLGGNRMRRRQQDLGTASAPQQFAPLGRRSELRIAERRSQNGAAMP